MLCGSKAPHDERPAVPVEELAQIAEQNARNLWLTDDLEAVSDEQWQRVLANVETRMRLRGVDLPGGWQIALTKYVGRCDV